MLPPRSCGIGSMRERRTRVLHRWLRAQRGDRYHHAQIGIADDLRLHEGRRAEAFCSPLVVVVLRKQGVRRVRRVRRQQGVVADGFRMPCGVDLIERDGCSASHDEKGHQQKAAKSGVAGHQQHAGQRTAAESDQRIAAEDAAERSRGGHHPVCSRSPSSRSIRHEEHQRQNPASTDQLAGNDHPLTGKNMPAT